GEEKAFMKPGPAGRLRGVLSFDDLEAAAQKHLPRALFAYVSGGVENNVSRGDNRAVFDEYALVPRVFVNVAQRSQAASLLGRSYAAPFGIAPMGLCAMTAYRGDL